MDSVHPSVQEFVCPKTVLKYFIRQLHLCSVHVRLEAAEPSQHALLPFALSSSLPRVCI